MQYYMRSGVCYVLKNYSKIKNLFNRRFHRAGNIHSQLRFGAVFGATLVYQRVEHSALKKEPEKAKEQKECKGKTSSACG